MNSAETKPYGQVTPSRSGAGLSDLVCGMMTSPESEHRADYNGQTYFFCSPQLPA